MSSVRKNARSKFAAPSLDASIFRMINEDLYTAPTQVAAKKFRNEPGLFSIYHKGFSDQVKQWSAQPFDLIKEFLEQPEIRKQVKKIGDIGCGQARLAKEFGKQFQIQSFDIGCMPEDKELVTIADMIRLPVKDGEFDMVVYSLSLMGTNIDQILLEANRVLKEGGILYIIEV